jgi:hypothetical protein
MIWILVLLVVALYGVFIMCLLFISRRADDQKEAIFTHSPTGMSENNFVSSLPATPEYMPWTSDRPQETPVERYSRRYS